MMGVGRARSAEGLRSELRRALKKGLRPEAETRTPARVPARRPVPGVAAPRSRGPEPHGNSLLHLPICHSVAHCLYHLCTSLVCHLFT